MNLSHLLSLPLVLCLALPAAAKPLPLKETLKIAAEIDKLIEADLAAKELSPNLLIPDDIFLRRSYLGIVGRIPTPQEAISFLDSDTADKRTQLIETLVASPGYDSASFNYFADLLRLQTNKEQYGLGWHVWLRESLAEDKPWDDMVHEMLAADGHTAKNPAVGYYLRDRGMLLDNVSNTMQVFLGHQIGCAQCHDHPFDRWSQMEYYELASFSSGITYQSQEARNTVKMLVEDHRKKNPPAPPKGAKGKKGKKHTASRRNADKGLSRKIYQDFRIVFKDFNKNEISELSNKPIKLPEDYQYEDGDPGEEIPPATLFGEKLRNVAPEDRREAFASWVTSGNPYFAKVFANRLWDRTFGHGLVDPVDNWSKEAETAHPKVLAYLEQVMARVDYRTRDFERILYHTRLFQRAASLEEITPGTVLAFQGPELRRMRAEEMHDSLLVLTYGNVDDKINENLADKWTAYRKSILELLSATPAELISLDKKLDAAEANKRAYQKESANLNLELRKANEAKNRKEANRIRQTLAKKRREYTQERNALSAMSMRNIGRGARAQRNMRASEYPTPFRGDHLVRQFGGSDRIIPEAAADHASIPQALTLLNGNIATTTENRNSKIFEALAEIANAETRLDYLFLAFYSAYPTAEERETFGALANDKDELFTLSRAMLTSKRFLFVQ
jgi:hypothetical protein